MPARRLNVVGYQLESPGWLLTCTTFGEQYELQRDGATMTLRREDFMELVRLIRAACVIEGDGDAR